MAVILNKDRTSGPDPLRRVSFEEFLADYDTQHAEWVDGEIIVMSPVSLPHQSIVEILTYAFGRYKEVYGGRLITAPFQMRLRQQRSGREPDISFVRAEHLTIITRNFVDGPVDLAVEVVSPDSIERDRITKYMEYEAAGVKEYWIIDPDGQECIFYALGPDQKYELRPLNDDESYRSAVLPELVIDTRWFWRLVPPGMSEIMSYIDLKK